MDNKDFLSFLEMIKESWEGNVRANLAFWLAVWYGEDKRERACKDDQSEFAFEFGLQIRPYWQEIDKKIKQGLIQAAVAAILAAVGIAK